MAKKNKKSGLTQNERRKIEEAQRKNRYILRLKNLLNNLGFGEAIKFFTPIDLERMSNVRLYMARFVPGDNKKAAGNRKYYDNIIYYLARTNTIPLYPYEDKQISIADFFEIWENVMMRVAINVKNNPEDDRSQNLSRIFDGLFALENEDDNLVKTYREAATTLQNFIIIVNLQISNPRIRYVWTDIKSDEYSSVSGRIERQIILNIVEPEIIMTTLEDKQRPAYRLGLPVVNEGVRWITMAVPPPKGQTGRQPEEYPVYIQSHALDRLYERLDIIFDFVLDYNIFHTFISKEFSWYGDRLIIPYEVERLKLGYFLADVIDNKIIIRTFLFITYNGTPEGNKLNRTTGLQKLDKNYLNIDKFSTFVATKIESGSQIAEIFKKAGCEHLFHLETLDMTVRKDIKTDNPILQDMFLKYINILKEE